MSLLLSPYEIKGLELRNRVVMSPMCMHMAADDGLITDWHRVHYGARAQGQTGLIFLETLAVHAQGRIGEGDLGIWSDDHVVPLEQLTALIHSFGAKVGAQIGHAGRKADLPGVLRIAPSDIPFTEDSPVPRALEVGEIKAVVQLYADAARRASEAGFDVLEIHAAHGYLANAFLSPLSNHRQDEYGGDAKGRYRFLSEILEAVKVYWGDRPLFVRISSSDCVEGGNTPESFLEFGAWMKSQGVDLIDCSSGGISTVRARPYPNFQVPAAELLRRGLDIATGAVGLIQTGRQAEEILQNGRADLIFVGRQMLRDPFWVRTAADDLMEYIDIPQPYTRYGAAWLQTKAIS
ncbi:NADPH dehydrogenase NamA [Pseudomonas syringae]|uniref:NADPH dehydrogenase NamA n=1 Tax=Pseudomonas syringae TaxID=317 RepID=UPI0018E5C335|nr:NADPH dehydrogenase NamA [Pseudomonas syringae]MBI6753796.1 NADPH dehydrogenase NamA [Pseudomonas syringae]MBI6773300.1 NADPH dehydrogenase NamA [Pseudomonas syringae]MBI6779029.1 NADPH dehydrogenase NamA [Pseudomonas syringae]MBI6793749.1 NADPH dehydrogenase NamA [Pseudomonas syringae]MBI6804238.1 NADPH dehydrogenase NamA [Pseudomonas syringae]